MMTLTSTDISRSAHRPKQHSMQQNDVEHQCENASGTPERATENSEYQKYSNLLFLLQSEPGCVARLCRLVSMAEIDSLLQIIMFTLYGNQDERQQEILLLSVCQVRPTGFL
jgi:Ras GTPase-activating-like protein IQGAP2/3